MSYILTENIEQQAGGFDVIVDGPGMTEVEAVRKRPPANSYPAHRRAARRRHARFGVFTVTTTHGQRIEPLNISRGGIAFLVPANMVLLIEDRLTLHLQQNDLHIATLTVRVAHTSRSGVGMIVGGAIEKVEIVPTSRHALPRTGDIVEIRDETLRTAVVQAIIARRVTGTMRLGEDGNVRVALEADHDVPSALLLRIDRNEFACTEAEEVLVNIAFELYGCELLLRASVTKRGDNVLLSSPWRLFSLGRRRCQRVPVPDGEAVIEWRDPLDPEHTRKSNVVDLSPQGLGVSITTESMHVFPAPPFPLTLTVGDLTVSLLGEVDHCTPCDHKGSVVGLSIRPFREKDAILLADACQSRRCPNLVKRSTVDLAALTQFMRESGYLSLREGTSPDLDWHNPPGDESLSVDTAYLADNGRVLGHISCLRLYRRTWLYHQLATVGLRRATIAYPLYIQLTEWTAALAGNQEGFAMAYFDPTKSWHQLMFGAFVRWAGSEELAVTKGLERLEATGPEMPGPAAGKGPIVVSEACKDELPFAATLARVHLPKLLADAIEMDVESISTANLCDEHTEFGLGRARLTFVAKHGRQIVGAAVCETGSRRLSLFNIVNVAYVFFVEPLDLRLARHAESALLRRVRQFYRDQNVLDPLIVAPEGNVKFAYSAGLTIAETMAAWVTSLDGLRQWRNFIHFEMGQMTRTRRTNRSQAQK
jgi:hypothetical protein